MGLLYKKSNHSDYYRFFTHSSDLKSDYLVYSLEKGEYKKNSEYNRKIWENGKAGIPISITDKTNEILMDHSDSHSLVIGPTGSKKSRLIAMPLVRILGNNDAKESMIISDPKSEIYLRTSAFLEEQGYKIHVINFRSPERGDSWNPLYIPYIYFDEGKIDRAYEFVNDIAENLIRTSMSEKDPFWDNSAGSVFFGLALLLFKYCKEHGYGIEYINIGNLIRLRNQLFTGSKNSKSLWQYAKSDSIIESALIGTIETANDTRAGILSVFDQKMRMFSIQPNLLSMLSENTANIDDLLYDPTAYFLILPDEKTGYHGLASLFIKQSYEFLIYSAQKMEDSGVITGLNRRINYVLDEFSSLPAICDFPEMITAARSRNIRFTLIIQSKNQLIQKYREQAETIMTNCNNWIFLTSRELPLLKEISELCGSIMVDSFQKSLLTIAELQRLNKNEGEVLVLAERKKPLITFLPDIKEYDNDNWIIRKFPHYPLKPMAVLDFKPVFLHETDDTSFDYDSLINIINQKIKELEEKEAGNKGSEPSEKKE